MEKVQSSKFELVEKFNGKNSFELWKLKMQDLLVQQDNSKSGDGWVTMKEKKMYYLRVVKIIDCI